MSGFTRRELMGRGAMVVAALSGAPIAWASAQSARTDKLWPGYPRQDKAVVSAVVGASHFDEARVKSLVKSYPELVNACWDWGYGDWETPLGAASHVGHRGIAEFLLAEGARMDIFAAAMLGYTDIVSGFVAARPGIQHSLGPHGIDLLSHAEAGEKEAEGTVEYLKSLGVIGARKPKVVEVAQEAKQRYLGEYASTDPELKLVCRLNRNQQLVVDLKSPENESTGRLIHCLGGEEFFPAGVPSVRLKFAGAGAKAEAVAISGSVPAIAMRRI